MCVDRSLNDGAGVHIYTALEFVAGRRVRSRGAVTGNSLACGARRLLQAFRDDGDSVEAYHSGFSFFCTALVSGAGFRR